MTPDKHKPTVRPRQWAGVMRLVADVVVPTLIFYTLRFLHMGTSSALLLSGTVPVALSVVRFRRTGRIDRIAVLAGGLFLFCGLVVLLGGSARLLFFGGTLIPLVIAAWMAVSHLAGRPLAYLFAIELLPARAARLNRLWTSSPKFRQSWRMVSIIWISGLVLDAFARVVVTALAATDALPALHTAIAIATPLLLQVITNIYLSRRGVFRAIFRDAAPSEGATHAPRE